MPEPNRRFEIRLSSHRICNPFDADRLASLGEAIHLQPGQRILDLACGPGELLATWARDHGICGHGVDISGQFIAAARARAAELGVADRVSFEEGDAAGYVADEPVDVAACLGAYWIGDGSDGTAALLARSVVPGGLLLMGQPYWRETPPDDEAARGCWQESVDDYTELPELLEHFADQGYDVVEMVCADESSWDRYSAAMQWNIRTWLDECGATEPDRALVEEFREELRTGPVRHARYQRRFLGWGVFALREH